MKESRENRCPDCDTLIPEASPGGLCPRCLLGGELTPLVPEEDDLGATLPIDPENPPVRGEPSRQELLTPLSSAAEFALTPEELDRLFPDLEILKLLGAGGMGAVYQARQPRLDRIVALKVLSCAPEMHDSFALRFEREAQLLAKLHHPHIVTLFDFGEIPDGPGGRSVFYFLMEYIGGGSLDDRLRSDEEIRPRDAFRIISETCEALALAHGKGVLHRDIKPANLLLDDEERIRVADFGIAKILEYEEESLMTGLTVTGTTMGTPHYMAPELWEDPTMVDSRADLYSVGVVFYQLLTREKPAGVFQEPSRIADVERMVDNVVFKALEKNRERRYQDAEEMRVAVERVATRHRQRVKRRRAKVLLATGIGVCLLGALGWSGRTAGLFASSQKNPSETEATESSSESVVPSALEKEIREIAGLPRGRLRHAGSGPNAEAIDFSRAGDHADFVDVVGSPDFWVALRSNGEAISSDGTQDATGIVKLCGSYHTHVVLVNENGGLVFREGKEPALPNAMEGLRFVDALVSNRHGIVLDETGRAHVFGEYYETDFDDGRGAGGYGTPKWPAPPEEAVTDVQAIAVAHTHAATLKKDGSLRVFGWEGLVDLPSGVTSKTFTQIASSPDQVCLLDTNGRAWRFGLTRNPHPEQPVGHAGKLLGKGKGKAKAIGALTSLDMDSQWRSYEERIDRLLVESLRGNPRHFVRDWVFAGNRNISVLWIEPDDGKDDKLRAKPAPALEIPPALSSLRERGGQLRAWTSGEEEMVGLDLTEGIDDFVRLDGLAYPGSDRWLALRSNGPGISPLTNFDRSGELVSLDTHIGILKDGTVLHCWDEQRTVKSRDAIAIDGEAGASSRDPFWLFLNRDGTVSLATNGDFRQWDDDEYARVRPVVAEIGDAVQIEAQAGTGVILRGNGEVVSWSNDDGLFVPDPPVANAVEVSCVGGGRWFALDSEGEVQTWRGPEAGWSRLDPPKDLPPVFAIRSFGTVAAAQKADGSWRAWGDDNGSGLIEQIHSIGPAADILFLSQRTGGKDSLLWIEPGNADEVTGQSLRKIPPELKALRERGGRLRSWGVEEEVIGVELAEGINDFVRLDGVLFPGSDRWLAIRRDGPSITPLPNFDRSGELVSLDSHLGVLRSGAIVKCYEESRKIQPGNASDGGYAGH
ncbi:MAG: protein kinase, partial [Verrucomicrobiales bacterium]|nr:protein kinase [Verrucomicrobiales bacterium]